MVHDGVVRAEPPVGQPVVAQELPHVLLRVQLGALGGQGHDGDVGWHVEPDRHVPARLIRDQHGMASRCDPCRDGGQVVVHGFRVAPWHDQACGLALLGADRAKDVGRCRALVMWGDGPGAAPCPAPGELVLLAYSGLVGEPDLDVAEVAALGARDRRHCGGKAFLKASTAPSACAWWRGRADSLR